MTITFYCPKCMNLCAFDSQYAGRSARCTKCNERFYIPSKDFEKAKIIKDFGDPIPGFFQSVFIRSWRAFFCIGGITAIVLLSLLVVLRFYLGHTDFTPRLPGFAPPIPLGWIVLFLTWGIQFWFYMEVVGDTSLEYDELVEMELGFGFEFFWTVSKSLYLFICACLVSLLPFVMLARLLRWLGVTSEWVLTPVLFGGFVLFPMVILILSTGQGLYLVFRLDYLIRPALKAPKAYAVLVLFVLIAAVLEVYTMNYFQVKNHSNLIICLHLAGNVLSAIFCTIAMRAIGLFGRHYPCYLPWLK